MSRSRVSTIVWGRDNIFKNYVVTRGDVDAAIAAADVIVEGEYETGAQEQLYIEPNGMVATGSPDDGVTVWGSMQCPYYIHKALKALFNLPADKVRVVQMETGGGFGGKEEYPSIIACHAALLAWKSGAPVKLVYDRAEDMVATTKRHPSRTRHRTAVTRDGRLVAMDIDFVIDGGAYCTLSPVVLSRGTIHSAGPYFCPNVRLRGRAVATNAPPHGAFRGFGAPQSLFALERHMDRVAAAVGLHAGRAAAAQLHSRRRHERRRSGDARPDRHGGAARSRAVDRRLSRQARALRRDQPVAARQEGHRARDLHAWRRIHRLWRRSSRVGRGRRGRRGRPRSRAVVQHRDRPGHQHDLRADRRRHARRAARVD